MDRKGLMVIIMAAVCFHGFSANLHFIKKAKATTGVTIKDALGIYVSCEYDFHSLVAGNSNDTSLLDGNFAIYVSLSENGKAITPAKGYQGFAGKKGELVYPIKLFSSDLEINDDSHTKNLFIPYASLNLPPGVHLLEVSIALSGIDGRGNAHSEQVMVDSIHIHKPVSRIVTMNIDHIEVTALNADGAPWDLPVYDIEKPDIAVSVMVGSVVIWENKVKDSDMFAVGPYSRNIQYTISEGDQLVVRCEDVDVMFNDFIAEWHFPTADKTPGRKNLFSKSEGVIKSAALDFRIDK